MRVLTLGTFDLPHAGHVALFARCRSLAGPGGAVIVGLNTDEFVQRYKGASPVMPYPDREAVISSIRHVDVVVPNDQTDGSARDVIEAMSPDIIAVGWDWRSRDYAGQLGVDDDYLSERWIKVVYLPYTPGLAGPSSAIKQRVWETTALKPVGWEVR